MKFVHFPSISVKLEALPLEFVPSLKLGTRGTRCLVGGAHPTHKLK